MTVASQTNCDDENPRQTNVPTSDDMSDVTPPTRGNGGNFDHGMVEKVIKFRFTTGGKGKQPVAPSLIHIHWMHAVQEALGHEIEILNNRNKKVETIDVLHWSSNPLIHQRQFKIYQKTTGRDSNRKTTYFILHRIMTTETVRNIKNILQVQKILRTHQCYITEHQWPENEWDTTSIGFVTNIDPGFYDRQQAQTKFRSFLLRKAAEVSNRQLRIKIPPFKMTFSNPTTTFNDQRFSTKAYNIEVKKEDQVIMMQTLKSLLQDTSIFVPYAMRHKYNEGFAQAIKFQTYQMTENMTIVLQNINESSMYYLENHIRSVNGVKDIIASKDVTYSGRFNVLVKKSEFSTARTTIQQNLTRWYQDHVPSDALPRPDTFSGLPCVRPIAYDGNSSGENSWMSKSNSSFLSMDLSSVQNDDYFSSSQSASRTFTYASILASAKHDIQDHHNMEHPHGSNIEDENREVISDITTARTESDSRRLLELETLRTRQNDEIAEARAIIKAQEIEIQKLKESQRQAADAYDRATNDLSSQQRQFAQRLSEQLMQADKKRNEEMEQMRKDMADLMKHMLQLNQDKTPHSDTRPHAASKRPTEAITGTELGNQECRQDKRLDCRNTPIKKLVFDEEHLLTQNPVTQAEYPNKEGDDASSISE